MGKHLLIAMSVAVMFASLSADAKAVKGSAKSSKSDKVAEMIAKSRSEEADEPPVAAIDGAQESADLNALLGDARLIAKNSDPSNDVTDPSADAAAVMGIAASGASKASANSGEGSGDSALAAHSEELSAIDPIQGAQMNANSQIDTKEIDAKKPEAEIPVLNSAPKKTVTSESITQRVMISIGVVLALSVFSIFGLKKWSKGRVTKANPQIKIITQHHLGPKRSVAIMQVAGESILIGITDHSITMLKSLSLIDDEVPEHTPRSFDFAMDEVDDRSHRSDDFAMSGLTQIRDTVSKRLRGLKEI